MDRSSEPEYAHTILETIFRIDPSRMALDAEKAPKVHMREVPS